MSDIFLIDSMAWARDKKDVVASTLSKCRVISREHWLVSTNDFREDRFLDDFSISSCKSLMVFSSPYARVCRCRADDLLFHEAGC